MIASTLPVRNAITLICFLSPILGLIEKQITPNTELQAVLWLPGTYTEWGCCCRSGTLCAARTACHICELSEQKPPEDAVRAQHRVHMLHTDALPDKPSHQAPNPQRAVN